MEIVFNYKLHNYNDINEEKITKKDFKINYKNLSSNQIQILK